MAIDKNLISSLFVHADTALIHGQRLGELCGHGPVLEQDIALTNISLDYIGRARLYYDLISKLEGNNKTEDDYAFHRIESEFKNLLLVEYPNKDFAYTVAKQFFIDVFYYHFFLQCIESKNQEIISISQKSLKETAYHKKWSSEWIIRLGDGTDISHQKMQNAVADLWMYVGEMFVPTEFEQAAIKENLMADLLPIKSLWEAEVKDIFSIAGIKQAENNWAQSGGKEGNHTEYMGYILSEMQYIPRTYPNMIW